MKYPKQILCLMIIGILTLGACTQKPLYSESIEIKDETWTYGDTLKYAFTIQDTSNFYDLFINIQHRNDFASQNLYSRIYTTFPDGMTAVDTLSFELTNNRGSWMGNCTELICDLKLLLKLKTRFQWVGDYQIGLEQYNRLDSLKGIQSIGFEIISSSNFSSN